MELDWTKIKCSMKEVHENVLFPWSKQTLMMQPLYYLYYIHLFVVFFSHLIDFSSPVYKCRLSRFILAERCKWISINNVNKHMKYQVCNKKKKSHQFNVESGCLMGKKTLLSKCGSKDVTDLLSLLKLQHKAKRYCGNHRNTNSVHVCRVWSCCRKWGWIRVDGWKRQEWPHDPALMACKAPESGPC